jgi:uncharacterized protein (DUF3084 family)
VITTTESDTRQIGIMVSPVAVFSEKASSMLLQPLIREHTDQLRNLDQKHRDKRENLKAQNIAVYAEKHQLEAKSNQLEAKVKALTEENEKLKTELATGSAGNGQQHGNFSRRIKDTKCRSTEARNSTPAIEYYSRIYQQETRG